MVVEQKQVEFWRWPESGWVNPYVDWQKGKLITAGVDVGSVSSKCVVMVDNQLFSFSSVRTGSDSPDSAQRVVRKGLEGTDMTTDNWDYCIGTGYGRVNVPMAQQTITEIACHARGANYMYGPSVRTVMDMGGQDCKAIRCDDRGKVLKFMMNDKCAAGTGRGMEVFADLIQVPVWEIGPRSFQINREPPAISSNCVVFAKTEVVGLLQEGIPENEIMAAYTSAMAHRIVELLNRLGVEKEFAITGGIAKNEGVVKRLAKELNIETVGMDWFQPEMRDRKIPFDTMVAGGIGAALFAQVMIEKGKAKSVRKV
jgi:benzoyl-CoA reductase subunit A